MNYRHTANKLLLIVFILFIAAFILSLIYKGYFIFEFLKFVLEAALVGGIADWFAVTALFSKPLGFSWHTAIIPRNRNKMIENVSVLVEKELLNAEAIADRLSSIEAAGPILEKLIDVINSSFLQIKLDNLVTEKINTLNRDQLSEKIDKLIKDNLVKEEVTAEIKNYIKSSVIRGKLDDWLASLLKKAEILAGKPETGERIYKMLAGLEDKSSKKASGTTAFVIKTVMNVSDSSEYTNLRSIASILHSELVELISSLRSEYTPMFIALQNRLQLLLLELDGDNTLSEVIHDWKKGILDNVDFSGYIKSMLSLFASSQLESSEASSFLLEHLKKYGHTLAQNKEICEITNTAVQKILIKLINDEKHIVSEIIKDSLSTFTDQKINKLVEDVVGEDLQWIRINGSIVGAAAGALLYIFTNLLYLPYIVPAIKSLFGG